MRLAQVRIKGYRCFQEETTIDVGNFTAILGRNDVGKSSVLEALQMFFEDTSPEAGDVCMTSDEKEVRIVCEFDALPQTLVIDADHPTSLQLEYMLNEKGRLEIHKVYDGSLKSPKLKGTFLQAQHPSSEGYADLLKLKNKELKERAQSLGVDTAVVPKTINTALRRAIREHAADLALAPTYLPVDEESTKRLWEQLKVYLPLFALFKADRPSTDQDSEAQDPMKVAVQEALKAQEEKLEEIRSSVEAAVLAVAKLTLEKLSEIDPSLAKELNPTVQRPNWATAFKIGLTDDAQVPINKRGSGVRRMILLNFFRARAERRNAEQSSPGVIYAIEEPETSQHPRNQRLLLKAFFELAESPEHQVLITTHNPVLARELPTSCLRLLVRDAEQRRVVLSNNDDTYAYAVKDLGVLPDHGVKAFIGVEGSNDIQFLRGLSATLSATEADIPNLIEAEEHGKIIFIPLNGSNLLSWVGRLQNLQRPEFHLYDRDTEPPAAPKYGIPAAEINLRAGCLAVHTDCRELENYIHPDAIRAHWPAINYQNHTPFTDVPLALAQRLANNWETLAEKARKSAENGVKIKLNSVVAHRMTAEQLTETDQADVIRGFLRRVGAALAAQ
jgi:putative ATP-dependent endonuclease of OLD family